MVAWCYCVEKMKLHSLHSFLTALLCTVSTSKEACAVLEGHGSWMGIDTALPQEYCTGMQCTGFEYLLSFPSVQLILKKALKANKTGEGGYLGLQRVNCCLSS